MEHALTPEEIEDYRKKVEARKISCDLPDCPFCGKSRDSFKQHGSRSRKFRILWGNLIHVVLCAVMRWKCQCCKKTFTQQPPFALPNKHYVREAILNFSGCYVEDDSVTYRQVVLDQEELHIFYASKPGEDAIDERSLAHSTPYRWITYLGGLKEVVRCAQDLLLQKNPSSTICRELAFLEVSSKKFVKDAREGVLKRCRQLLHLEAEFRGTFFSSIFPLVATRCGWG